MKSAYVCNQCGYKTSKWQGQCPSCKSWNTLEEVLVNTKGSKKGNNVGKDFKAKSIKDIKINKKSKISTGINEFDRALSGGIINGQVILIAGNPGIGKSTLLLQLAANFKSDKKRLYVSAEESEEQVALRADRLNLRDKLNNCRIIASTDIDLVLNSIDDYGLIIVDSIQMMNTYDLQNRAGSVPQVVECTNRIVEIAKSKGVPFVIVGHITKDGLIAGPKTLEHMVDTVLYLDGDKQSEVRLLRVQKNRFGSDFEVGVFTMTETGLESVRDISKLFNYDMGNSYGNAHTIIIEGSRPMAVEVQALTVKTSYGYPKRTATGISLNRLQMLIAVIQKYLGLKLGDYDIFVNVTSGMNIKDPSIDLAVVAAIISSYYEKPLQKDSVYFGEVGLTSEVRPTSFENKRIKEAKVLNYKNIYTYKNVNKISQIKKSLV